MNQSQQCHKIEGVKTVFIDAFKAFKFNTQNSVNCFILTHYHSDHYTGLPSGSNYKGPATIHCTPVTANLLREIHKIPDRFIVAHEYGETWSWDNCEITFYDANHCPGAAIIFAKVKIGNSFTYHVHTGDMRYHPKFRSYPLLKEAVEKRLIDVLYLDTTYAKPKHTFLPQQNAIDKISSQVQELLKHNHNVVEEKKNSFFQPKKQAVKDSQQPRTLVLLSCYSIGKEKVLWHSAVKSDQLVYVNNAKHKLLKCIECGSDVEEANGIVKRSTLDPQKSDIHVIKMGLAGTLHPFFQPNFNDVALYAHRMNKGYNKVVAFLPTGWAESSKYNKQNSIATKVVNLKDLVDAKKIKGNIYMMHVEVRLMAYSEHSSYTELRDCVEFMKPKRVIPTVFSGEKDYEAIEKRFSDLVDSQRAKQSFINSMFGTSLLGKTSASSTSSIKRKHEKSSNTPIKARKVISNPYAKKVNTKFEADNEDIPCNKPKVERYKEEASCAKLKSETLTYPEDPKTYSSPSIINNDKKIEKSISTQQKKDCGDNETVEYSKKEISSHSRTTTTTIKKSSTNSQTKVVADDHMVAQLVSMGFNSRSASESLSKTKNNIERAVAWLLMRKK